MSTGKDEASACNQRAWGIFNHSGQVEIEYILILFVIVLVIFHLVLKPLDRILVEYYYANISFFLSLPFP